MKVENGCFDGLSRQLTDGDYMHTDSSTSCLLLPPSIADITPTERHADRSRAARAGVTHVLPYGMLCITVSVWRFGIGGSTRIRPAVSHISIWGGCYCVTRLRHGQPSDW